MAALPPSWTQWVDIAASSGALAVNLVLVLVMRRAAQALSAIRADLRQAVEAGLAAQKSWRQIAGEIPPDSVKPAPKPPVTG